MKRLHNYLFCSGDLGEALRQHQIAAIQAVDAISESRFAHQSDEQIVAEVLAKYTIRPLELIEKNSSMKQSETKLDVSGHPFRNPFQDPGPILVSGVRVTVSVPFVGDASLWKLLPSTYTTTFPVGEIHRGPSDGGTLVITVEQPSDEEPVRLKEMLDGQMRDVRFYIENQKTQISTDAAELPRRVASAVADRRQRLLKHRNLSELLGIPAASPSNPPLAQPRSLVASALEDAPQVRGLPTQTERWDIFISHASEDKDEFARPLADALTAAGLRVWFDEFALTVGDSLRRSIDKGLANSKYGVVVISPAFLKKDWPQKELDGLVARETNGEKVILPVWHNINRDTLMKYSPTLADRLATNSAKGLNKVVEDLRSAIHAG